MKLFITKKAQKDLDKIPDPLARQIAKQLLTLRNNPYPLNSKKLKGKENYRIRVGSFRALYTIGTKKKEITILRIADRKDVYK